MPSSSLVTITGASSGSTSSPPSPQNQLSEQPACNNISDTHFTPATASTTPPIYEDSASATAAAITAAAGLLPHLDHYRLQLYNYAMVERLRCSQAAAVAYHHQTATFGGSGGGNAALAHHHNLHQHSSHMNQQQHQQSPQQHYSNSHHIGQYTVAAAATSPRIALSMSLFHNRLFQHEEPKPQHSYIGLIAMAILSVPDNKLVLSDIYQHILDNYPYFRSRGPGWRNSIRHNLSLNDCFIKSGRSANGKGHYWAIHPANVDDFKKGDFRRRKAQRKVRKHMGLAVDEDGGDSPSPPPLSLSPIPIAAVMQQHQQHPHLGYHHQHHQHHHHNVRQHQTQQHLSQLHHQNITFTHHSWNTTATTITTSPPLPPAASQGLALSLQANERTLAIAASSSPPYQSHRRNFSPPSSLTPPVLESTFSDRSTITATSNEDQSNHYLSTKKRQFDVASLLAPDDNNKIRKRLYVTEQQQFNHHNQNYHSNHSTSPLTGVISNLSKENDKINLLAEVEDDDDIDVVAEDILNDDRNHRDRNCMNNNHNSMDKEDSEENKTKIIIESRRSDEENGDEDADFINTYSPNIDEQENNNNNLLLDNFNSNQYNSSIENRSNNNQQYDNISALANQQLHSSQQHTWQGLMEQFPHTFSQFGVAAAAMDPLLLQRYYEQYMTQMAAHQHIQRRRLNNTDEILNASVRPHDNNDQPKTNHLQLKLSSSITSTPSSSTSSSVASSPRDIPNSPVLQKTESSETNTTATAAVAATQQSAPQ